MINAYLINKNIFTNSSEAINLQNKSNFGEKVEDKIQYSIYETMFLIEDKKLEILSNKSKKIEKKELEKIFVKIDKKFLEKYTVFKDLRKKGYTVKSALKFGADFRVYEKGSSPDEAHAKWIVFVNHETEKNSWQEFCAKNRIANSTKKRILLAIVDEEAQIIYYEINWLKP